ncbi:MAG: hypothetical protein JWR20_746 [Marmoricola sp.]|nr:hypothetical protein [Marmoricola sp.]
MDIGGGRFYGVVNVTESRFHRVRVQPTVIEENP